MNLKIPDWVSSAVDLIYPRQCQYCQDVEKCRHYSFICDECLHHPPRIVPPFCDRCCMPFDAKIDVAFECPNCREMPISFDKALSVMRFRGVVREAIHDFKYSERLYWRKVLQRWVSQGYVDFPELADIDLVLPVPLHPVRLRTRGFNQASVLVQALEKAFNVKSSHRTLARVRETVTQINLDRFERMKNLEGAFKVLNPETIEGKKLLLVDDVLTTGSTVNECSKTLKKAGATSVLVFTLARG